MRTVKVIKWHLQNWRVSSLAISKSNSSVRRRRRISKKFCDARPFAYAVRRLGRQISWKSVSTLTSQIQSREQANSKVKVLTKSFCQNLAHKLWALTKDKVLALDSRIVRAYGRLFFPGFGRFWLGNGPVFFRVENLDVRVPGPGQIPDFDQTVWANVSKFCQSESESDSFIITYNL